MRVKTLFLGMLLVLVASSIVSADHCVGECPIFWGENMWIEISGTPNSGQILTASNDTAASWQDAGESASSGNASINGSAVVGDLCIINNATLIGSQKAYIDVMFNYTLAQTSNNNDTVYVEADNLTLYLPPDGYYDVNCHLINNAAAATTGVQLRVNTTNSPGFVRTTWMNMDSATVMGAYSGTNTSSNAFTDTGSSTASSIGFLSGFVITGSSQSVWTIELKSEVAGSAARIQGGSWCTARKVG